MADGNTTTSNTTTKTREEIEAAYAATAPAEPAEHFGPDRWRYFVHVNRAWCEGRFPCECCDAETQAACGDCMGTGRRLISPRSPWVEGMIELEHGFATLADLVADFDARGGIDLLPARSQKLIEELRNGLGEQLYVLLGRLQDLEEDMEAASEDPRWPGGEALYEEQQRASERREEARRATETSAPATTTAIGDEAAAKWVDASEWAYSWCRGEQTCGNCDGSREMDGETCTDCNGTGLCSGVEPTRTIGRQAANVAGELDEPMGSVASVIAGARVAEEKQAAGLRWPNVVSADARPFLDELEALAPTMARIAVLLERIDVAQTDIDSADPREQRYAQAYKLPAHLNATEGEGEADDSEATKAIDEAQRTADALHSMATTTAAQDYAEGEQHRAECDGRDREVGDAPAAHYLSDVVATDLAEAVETIEVSCLTLDKLHANGTADETTAALTAGLREEARHVAHAAALSRAIYERIESKRTAAQTAAE